MPDISRELAYIRNQPGGNWLAQALHKLAAAQNAAQAARPAPAPPQPAQSAAVASAAPPQQPLLVGNNNKPVVDLADPAHANRSLAALSGNLNDVPDSATRFAAVEASADHTLNHVFFQAALGQTADPAMNSTATWTQIDGMSVSVDVVGGAALCLIQFAGAVGSFGSTTLGYGIQLWVDGASVAEFDPPAPPQLDVSQVFSFVVSLGAGSHTIQAMCANAPAASTWKGLLRTLSVLGTR